MVSVSTICSVKALIRGLRSITLFTCRRVDIAAACVAEQRARLRVSLPIVKKNIPLASIISVYVPLMGRLHCSTKPALMETKTTC